MLKVDPKLMQYFKNHEYGPEIIMVSLYMKGRYSLSYREIEEIGGLRGLNIDHATLQRWVVKFMPTLEGRFKKRKKPVNGSGERCPKWLDSFAAKLRINVRRA